MDSKVHLERYNLEHNVGKGMERKKFEREKMLCITSMHMELTSITREEERESTGADFSH